LPQKNHAVAWLTCR